MTEKRKRSQSPDHAESSQTITRKLPPIVGHDDTTPKDQASTGEEKRVKKKKVKMTPGIVYISRVPPGMTPQKIRHLMSKWGEVGKVYAQPRDVTTNGKSIKKKHTPANYTEAWVEFLDKSIGKTAAKVLNAQVIGGKPGDRWREDVWTMKYLSGFKWEMLGEQVAYERQSHQARLRNEISKSRVEQSEYLRNVELARVLDKRKNIKDSKSIVEDNSTSFSSQVDMVGTKDDVKVRGEKNVGKGEGKVDKKGKRYEGEGMERISKLEKGEKVGKKYKQRTVVYNKPIRDGMEGVLDNLFG
ncbi:hypothetical protein TREMEDRAFT_73771 [Tremella mesenterica DSM 1558]|uniref:uncharacterized protein n=1 Tax=Tremella mesenterica (strain ATCC 24925 / CBS 8224 / DSM 1558 / NBRC 9311 / NRRL Y-6157 / RJB 2259-6 / UBC 559-6) TaxID=578456 RepID=UPI0003F4A606|nr:uncharacterized protein TREMEDRAFT_73771 [Tremella mesenterica DSM 1558]EIW70240.1 hypothetical protein TREMEDRAFT_73771 [Tremella mesenterica DSM 1558]